MPQDALTQSAAALGIQTEPAENFFDPAQSARLMARYAPAAMANTSTKMLGDQADKARQMDMHEAQFRHEQKIWGRKEKDMEDQDAIDTGELLHSFAGLSPTLPKIGQDGNPTLDRAGNPVMTINPDYLPTMSKLYAETPGLANNQAFKSMEAFKNAEYQRTETNQFKEQALAEHVLNMKSNYVNRSIDGAVRRGVKPEAIAALSRDEYGLPDPVAVAELQSGVVSNWREDKDTLAALNRKQALFKDDIRALGTRTNHAKFFAPDGRPHFEKQYQNAASALMKEELVDDERTAWNAAATSKTREGFVDEVVKPTLDYNNQGGSVDHSEKPPKFGTDAIKEWHRVEGLLKTRRRIANDYFDAVNELNKRDDYESEYQGLTGEELSPKKEKEPIGADSSPAAPPVTAPSAPPVAAPATEPEAATAPAAAPLRTKVISGVTYIEASPGKWKQQ